MQRHALSPLFDPQSLVVVSHRPLPLMRSLPAGLRSRAIEIAAEEDGSFALPPGLPGGGARPELAVVSVPGHSVRRALENLAPARPLTVAVLTHEPSRENTDYCRRWAEASDCIVLGPHSFGLQRPHAGLNASLHPQLARAGRVALVTQSRSIMAVVLDWADDNHTAFSTVVSLGSEAMLDVPRVLDFLVADSHTDSIALYLEHVDDAREFMSSIRAAASVKPVVVLKAGHTPPDAVFDAAVRRAGAVRVRYFVELFAAVKALSYAKRPAGRRIAIFSNGSGPARLTLDLLGPDHPVARAQLEPATREALASTLSEHAWLDNPVVEFSPPNAQACVDAVQHLIKDPGVDGVLAVFSPDPEADMREIAQALARLAPVASKPLVTCFMGDAAMRPLRRLLDDVGAPSFRTPEAAVDAFGNLTTYLYNQQLLLQIPPPEPPGPEPDQAGARALLARVRQEGRLALDKAEARAVLAAFHLPAQVATISPNAIKVSMGVSRDSLFGPVISLGPSRARGDSPGTPSVELPPLNGFLARRLMERSPTWPYGLSQVSPHTLDLLEDTLVRLSEIVCALPDIESIDINPVVIENERVLTADARIVLTARAADASAYDPGLGGYAHIAIHPYPAKLVRHAAFADGAPYTIRPIRPEDATPLQDFTRELSEHTRYMRFISLMRELPPRTLARYTQLDYHRELALVATVPGAAGTANAEAPETIIGVARYLLNPDGASAEYSLVIADAWQRRGLGKQLMTALIGAARTQGLRVLEGVVLGNNRPMRALMQSLGFQSDLDQDDPDLRRVWLEL